MREPVILRFLLENKPKASGASPDRAHAAHNDKKSPGDETQRRLNSGPA
jgi:hypothetical protein